MLPLETETPTIDNIFPEDKHVSMFQDSEENNLIRKPEETRTIKQQVERDKETLGTFVNIVIEYLSRQVN